MEDCFSEFPIILELSVNGPGRHKSPAMREFGRLSRKRLPGSPERVISRNAQGVADGADHLGLPIFYAFLRPIFGGDHRFERAQKAAIQLAQKVAHHVGLRCKRGLGRHEPARIDEVACGRTADEP